MSAAYFTAAIPEPYRILGLRLRPLSLGRYRLLQRFEVAFVSDEVARAGIHDLFYGVLICSMRVNEFLSWIESPNYFKDLRRFGKKIFSSPAIGMIPWLGKRWRKKHGFNVVNKIELFQRYIRAGSLLPDYWLESGSDSHAGGASHWAQNVEVVLRSELGWTNEEINEQPLTKALSDYFNYAESQGLVRLMTAEEKKLGEENGRLIAELEKRMQAQSRPGGVHGS